MVLKPMYWCDIRFLIKLYILNLNNTYCDILAKRLVSEWYVTSLWCLSTRDLCKHLFTDTRSRTKA